MEAINSAASAENWKIDPRASAQEDYVERFEIWAMTKEDDEDVNIVAHFLTFIGKEAYSLLKTLALPKNPISLSRTTLKDLLLDYVKYTNFECGKGGRFRKMIHEDITNFTALRHPNPVHTPGYPDNSFRSCDEVHEGGHTFGQCLSCGKFHSFNSCKFCNSKCFKCGDIGHIQSVCNTTVHSAATNIKSCNTDFIKLSIYNDHLSLSMISKDSVESYSSSELYGTQNSCETTVFNQLTHQIFYIIVPGMAFPNDSLISDEIPCKSEENILNGPSHDRKPDVVVACRRVAVVYDHHYKKVACQISEDDWRFDILNKFKETISEESNRDVLSNIIFLHNAFVSCWKLVQCEAQVLNKFDSDYYSDDFISTVVYPYHEVTSNVYSSKWEKYVLNEATSFITRGNEDPTLFRGEG
ncbi:unnamed protein product [Schistosoma curassoni]|uniref:CCHC-type domain-containing protein n=1 Tax=Schistosoma curassoni TaxID=6186 RepID=A0A183JDE5_9TREM|nr:unnamed protein product [Schistosoma curassoni]